VGIRQERSVRNLQELYTVTIGVSLAVAISHLVSDNGFPISSTAVPPLAAFLLTIVPFYHGAMRHLDRVYVEEGGRNMRRASLIGDFSMLFIEACLFLTLANQLRRPGAFAWTLVALWAFDAIWGSIVYLIFATHRHHAAEVRWVVINLVAAPALAVFLLIETPPLGPVSADTSLTAALIAFPTARSVLDYLQSWSFYFPARLEDARTN
jgi:hypothetical protein